MANKSNNAVSIDRNMIGVLAEVSRTFADSSTESADRIAVISKDFEVDNDELIAGKDAIPIKQHVNDVKSIIRLVSTKFETFAVKANEIAEKHNVVAKSKTKTMEEARGDLAALTVKLSQKGS